MSMATASQELNWANLPSLPLDMILKKVIPLQDFLCFGAVCKSWRNAAMNDPKHTQQRFESCTIQVPFLMMPIEGNEKRRWIIFKKRRWKMSLYTLSGRKLPNFQLSLPHNLRCCGSSHGWLAFCKDSGKEYLSLYNPFSHKKLSNLPTFNHPSCWNPIVLKVILSANPSVSPDEFYVVAICGRGDLAVLKYSQKSWTYVRDPDESDMYMRLSDLIFHKGQLYSITFSGNLMSIDMVRVLNKESYSVCKIEVSPRLHYPNGALANYLVESSRGELLLVRRSYTCDDRSECWKKRTVRFEVFKVILGSNNSYRSATAEFVEVKSLEGDALFVGDHISSSVSASNVCGCQPDFIYFTHNVPYYGEEKQILYDVGVYNLKSGSIERYYQSWYTSTHLPPPMWITPTPHF